MDRELLQGLCDEYVLGVLEGEELTELEALLERRDPDAMEALQRAERTAADLALSAPQVDPPAGLALKLRDRIHSEPQETRIPDTTADADPEPHTNVVTMPSSRPGPLSWLGWIAAAGLLLGIYYVNESGVQQSATLQGELDEAQLQIADLQMTVDQQQEVINIIGAQDSRAIRLVNTAQPQQFAAYWSNDNGLVLVGTNIPAPAPGRTMQLWVVPNGANPISAGVFQPRPDGSVLLISNGLPDIANAAALAISDEPDGGSPQPTTTPAWVGAVGG